jgi:hypothetical protein
MHAAKLGTVLTLSMLLAAAAEAQMKPGDLAMQETSKLCMSYAAAPAASQAVIRDELEKRSIISDNDWEMADKHMVRPGMSVCGLFAAWGQPDSMTPDAGGANRYGYETSAWPGVAANRSALVKDGRVAGTKP